MDEQHNNGTPQGTDTGEQQSAAGSGDSGYVTADQLQDFSKSIMGEIRKTVAGMLKTQQPPQQEQPKGKPKAEEQAPQGSSQDVRALLEAERQLGRSLRKHGFNDDQEELVRQMVDKANPEDVASFVEGLAKTFGVGGKASSEETTTMQQPKGPNPNPASDGGTPGMTPSADSDDQPMWKWSEDKVNRFISEKGYREFAKLAKSRIRRDFGGVRFALPRQG